MLSGVFAAIALITAAAAGSLPAPPRSVPQGPRPMAGPIQVHPENPRYLLYRGKPILLITSAEHYGAVLNSAFDFRQYLAALQRDGMNYTRIFSGAYCESPTDFNIQENTLAPESGRLLCPWARSETPGYANGGSKFDLTRWDAAYFRRLKDFLTEAGRRGVVVELTLFCPFYGDSSWRLSPMNAANNIQGIGKAGAHDVYNLKHPDLTRVQEEMVRKVVTELNGFDNLFYEICNEPYFGGVTLEWQRRIAEVIVATEASLPKRHLIAQNIANGSARAEGFHPSVSLLNFHYAAPPDAVKVNWDLNRPVGCDETGFKGTRDLPYRREGWDFLLAGGALYNNLDYSFTVRRPDGTHTVTDPTPGGGGPSLRAQLKTLSQFMHALPFTRMRPANELLRGGKGRLLAAPGEAYAAYTLEGTRVTWQWEMPAGRYRGEWVHPLTGKVEPIAAFDHPGGLATFSSPEYTEDIALKIVRVGKR